MMSLSASLTVVAITLTAWLGVAGAEELPQFDYQRDIVCTERPDGIFVRLQCDHEQRQCLEAQPYVIRHGQPTPLVAAEMRRCFRGEPDLYRRLVEEGYEMIPARLESPRGYRRDSRGRLIQESFDLRRRGYLGVGNMANFGPADGGGLEAPRHGLTLEIGGVRDRFERRERRRRRTRILQGRFIMSPVELNATIYRFDTVRGSDEPGLWVALPFGDLRLDIPLQLGVGAILGRVNFQNLDGDGILLADLVGVHTTWEFYQGTLLENYALVRLGVGSGIRSHTGQQALYFYPEAGVEMAWTLGERGLTQVSVESRLQLAAELATGEQWFVGEGSVGLEQIIFIVSDNPASLFIRPEVRYDRLAFADQSGFDLRLLAGVRISGFVSPRPAPEDSRIPLAPVQDPRGQ